MREPLTYLLIVQVHFRLSCVNMRQFSKMDDRKYTFLQWRSQPKYLVGAKKFWGRKMLDFGRITLFCLEKRLSKHKMTIFSKYFGGEHGPFAPLAMPMPLWQILTQLHLKKISK